MTAGGVWRSWRYRGDIAKGSLQVKSSQRIVKEQRERAAERESARFVLVGMRVDGVLE